MKNIEYILNIGGIYLEVRKLIKFGNSSHVISLPSFWLKKNNLNKGDIVYFKENGSDELILSPQLKENKEEFKEATIDTSNKTLHSIKREIVSAYINNNKMIKVTGKNLDKYSTELREFIHNLLAVEIIEETQSNIVARDFLNIKTLSITNILRRIDIILRSMLSDARDVREKRIIYDNLMNRDKDVNRLTILAYKASRYYMENPNPKENYTVVDYFKLWSMAESLEKIGDEAKRFARYLRISKLPDKRLNELLNVYLELEKIYIDTMSAFYKKDRNLLLNQAAKRDSLMKKLDEYLDKNGKFPCTSHLIEKLKNLLNHTHSIIKVTTYN